MRKQTRVVVTGKYINSSTYVLTLEDGTVFQTIREGEPFRIGNQIRQWNPERVSKINGYGTILVCRKYRDDGLLVSEFPLIHRKKGLWAITSGAARRGVFHTYTQPQNDIEVELCNLGFNPNSLERVTSIDTKLKRSFSIEEKLVQQEGYIVYTDGKEQQLTKHEKISSKSVKKPSKVRIYNATYIVQTFLSTDMDGVKNEHVVRVIVTPQGEDKLLEVLKSIDK